MLEILKSENFKFSQIPEKSENKLSYVKNDYETRVASITEY
jgi:hypothetical protein